MKTSFIIVFLIMGLLVMPITTSRADDKGVTGELIDGFLVKDYAISFSEADHIEFEITKNWLSIQRTKIPNGYIRIHGVGDDKGEFQLGQKGGLVEVKIVSKADKHVTVGIKVGNGNLEASQKLHNRFQEILDAERKSQENGSHPKG